MILVEWAQFRDGYQTGICYQRATQPDHPLLIFLHDSRWYGQQFDLLFPRLVDYGNLLAPNLRGHGPLAAHRGEIDYIGQFEDDIADLIDLYARPGQKVVLAGHSSGGGLAIRFLAEKYRHKVQSVILKRLA